MATVNPYEAEVQRRRRELEAQAAMLRKGGLTPEQMAVLAQESGYDGSDRQDMMADLMRTGQAALIGGEIPAGKQVGNILAPVSWSEALNAGAQRALGGYQIGQARREGREIDKREQAALEAKQSIANEQARLKQLGGIEKQQDVMLRQAGQDAMAARRLEQSAAIAEANRNAANERNRLTVSARNKGKGSGNGSGKLSNLQYKLLPTGERVQIGQNNDGVWYQAGSNTVIPDPSVFPDALNETQVSMGKKELRKTLVEDINPLKVTLDQYDARVKPYAKGGEKERPYSDIPGQGVLSGKGGVAGYAARMGEKAQAALGLSEDSPSDPELIFASARDLANMKIREGAGLSQTAAEIERMKSVLEGEFGTDPLVVKSAIDRVKQAYNADMEAMKSTLPQQVLNSYSSEAGKNNPLNHRFELLEYPEQGATSNRTVQGTPNSKGGEKTIKRTGTTKDGRRVIEYSDGTREYR